MRRHIGDATFSIRLAAASDIEPMRALERRAAQRFLSIGYDYCADGPVRDPEEHVRAMTEGVTIVAEAGGDLAGFAMAERLDGEGHLVEIDVDPLHQGCGMGRRLIVSVEDWAGGHGFVGLTLTTYRDVPWNAPYYARLGFTVFEPGPERPGLRATIAKEAAAGFAFAPRVAMRKKIGP